MLALREIMMCTGNSKCCANERDVLTRKNVIVSVALNFIAQMLTDRMHGNIW
jgi:hypothetical protein